jgi:hypothetical protein
MMKYRGSKEVMMMAGETGVRGGKPVPVKMSPPQIPRRLGCDRTHVSAMKAWQLIL